MSRPRFLADHDFNDRIVQGVLRRESAAIFLRARDLGLERVSDDELLKFAAEQGAIVVSHDRNTMTAAAARRIERGFPMPGLIITKQRDPVGPVIDSFVLIWACSEAEEWESAVVYVPWTFIPDAT